MERRRKLNGAEIRELLQHDWPLVEVTVPLVVILMLGAFDVITDKTAILVAMIAALVELAVAGAYAARVRGSGRGEAAVSAAIAVALGGVVVPAQGPRALSAWLKSEPLRGRRILDVARGVLEDLDAEVVLDPRARRGARPHRGPLRGDRSARRATAPSSPAS